VLFLTRRLQRFRPWLSAKIRRFRWLWAKEWAKGN
jgi:hypothetical protein